MGSRGARLNMNRLYLKGKKMLLFVDWQHLVVTKHPSGG
jgi:hypothetical protein